MRIAIDLSSITVGAGPVYAMNILAAIGRTDSTNEYVVLLTTRNGISVPTQRNFSSVCWAPRSAAMRVPFFQAVIPWWLKRRAVDVLVSPFEYTILAAPCPIVLGMQNLSPYSGPSASTPAGHLRCRMIRRLAWLSVRRAARIFFVSDASRRIICDSLGIGMERTAVVPYGVDTGELAVGGNDDEGDGNAAVRELLASPYILSVSSVMAHKDFESLLRAYANLLQKGLIAHRLAIAGPLIDKPYLEKLQRLISTLNLGEKVVFLGEVPHGSIGKLYRRAEVMVLPSHTETFGMPMIEAMACGCPVIASDLPALREVAGEAGRFYSPGDATGLSGQLEHVLTDGPFRASMVEVGIKRASHFSWDSAAREVLGLINEAFGN